MRKVITYLLVFILIFNIIGCGSTASQDSKKTETVTEYLRESEINTPKKILSCLDFYENEKDEYFCIGQTAETLVWKSTDKGKTWKEQIKLPKDLKDSMVTEAQFTEDGSIFLVVLCDALKPTETEQSLVTQFYYASSDGEFQQVELEGKEEGFTDIVYKNDILYGKNQDGVVKGYDCKTGKLKDTFQKISTNVNQFVVTDKQIIIVSGTDGVQSYDLQTKEPVETKKNLKEKMQRLSAQEGKWHFDEQSRKIVYAGIKGIFEYDMEKDVWRQLLYANGHELSSMNNISDISIVGKDKLVVSFVNIKMKPVIYHYTYEEKGHQVKTNINLTLYSLEKLPEVEDVVNQFNAMQDNIYVNYEFDSDVRIISGTIRDDSIKKLNTQLMAGEGPDIVFLDGLNPKPYMEKGILHDITELGKENGNLLNIAAPFTSEGKVFGIPLSFQLMGIHADEKLVNTIDSFNEFTKQLQQMKEENPNKRLVENWRTNEHMEIFFQSYYQDLFENGKLSRDKLSEFYVNMKKVYEISEIENYNWLSLGIFNIDEQEGLLAMDDIKVSIGGITNLTDLEAINSFCKDKENLKFSFYNKNGEIIFLPNTILAISESSNKIKEAEEFVKYCISDQGYDEVGGAYYSFPTNKKMLENWLNRSFEGSMEYQNSKGERKEFKTDKLSEEFKADFLKKVEETTAYAYVDPVIKEIIMKGAEDYINQKETLEEAATKVTEKINLYQQE